MQHIQRAVVTVNGLSLAYAEVGRGKPVIYLHGAVTSLEEGLIGLASTLGPHHRLIAFDRPGHGDSDTGPGCGSVWRQAALLHEAVSVLGVVRPVVIGHSFGGAVATAWGLQFPDDVAGIVALAPIAFPEPRLEQIMFGLRALPGTGLWMNAAAAPLDSVVMPVLWNGMFLPQPMTPAFRAGFPFDKAGGRSQLKADGEEALLMARDLARSAMAYATAKVPLTVLQGDRDAVVNPMMHGRLLTTLWPDSEFVSLPGLGHMAHHFNPEAVLTAVQAMHGRSETRLAA